MNQKPVHQCPCDACQTDKNLATKAEHERVNLFMSRLDEQQRRWYAALEAERHGHGGTKRIATITGLSEKTVRRGRHEMDNKLEDRPVNRQRVAGGGRPAVEKKRPR